MSGGFSTRSRPDENNTPQRMHEWASGGSRFLGKVWASEAAGLEVTWEPSSISNFSDVRSETNGRVQAGRGGEEAWPLGSAGDTSSQIAKKELQEFLFSLRDFET